MLIGLKARTWFCENGHIVLDIPYGVRGAHSIGDFKKCKYCESTKFACELEWRDKNHRPKYVPTAPIRTETPQKIVRVFVYDVSQLFVG